MDLGCLLHRFSAHSGCIHALSVVPLWRSEGRTRHSSSSSCLDNSQDGEEEEEEKEEKEEKEEEDVARSGGYENGGDAQSGEEGERNVGRGSDEVAEHVSADPPPAEADSVPQPGAPEEEHTSSPMVVPHSRSFAGRRSPPVAYVVVTSGEDGAAKVWSYGPWEAADDSAATTADVAATVAGTAEGAAGAAAIGEVISVPGPLAPPPTPPLLAGQPPRLVCTARMPQPQGQQQQRQQHKGKKQGGGGGGGSVWARPWTTSCVLPIGLAGRNNSGGDRGGTGSLWVAAAGTTGGIAVFQIMPGEC